MPATLTLTRRGEINVLFAHDDSTQCGLKGTRKLFYRVEITCPDTELDDNGFMVDQLEVNAAITARYAHMDKFVSCERLAIDCSRMVAKMVKNALKVKVTIGATKLAFMTCVWEKSPDKKGKK